MALAEPGEITACLSNTSITDIFYVINKHTGQEKPRILIADILDTFSLTDIDKSRVQTYSPLPSS